MTNCGRGRVTRTSALRPFRSKQVNLTMPFGRLPLRKKLAACGCNNAMPQSCSVMSQNCPLPDFSRSCSATRIAIAEKLSERATFNLAAPHRHG
jgi:hypothetical protein